MDAMLERLLGPLASLRDQLGFAPADLPAWWRAMRGLINTRLRQHLEAMHEAREWPVDDDWVERIADRFGRLPERVPGGWTIAAQLDQRAQEFYVINCADLRLPDIYRFTLDDLVDIWPGKVSAETVRTIVSQWAMRPEEYAGISMQTLPVDNPVVARPFVTSGEDTWHLFCGWLPLHNPFGLIESALTGDAQGFARYLHRRAQFLEERLVELLAAGLPGATVERSLLSIDPASGKEYENDVLALISSFAVIAEAKAGGLHPGRASALRRAQRRTARNLRPANASWPRSLSG
jgi:hypothetical protein